MYEYFKILGRKYRAIYIHESQHFDILEIITKNDIHYDKQL